MANKSKSTPEPTDVFDLLDQVEDEQTLEVTVRKESDEIILRNTKNNKILKLKTAVEDSAPSSGSRQIHLKPEEFEDGVRRIYALGLEFSAELYPSLFASDETSPDLINAEELRAIQASYPQLPREVGFVAHNRLTGQNFGILELGGTDFFNEKAKVAEKFVLTSKYREEFFFKHALKVPYFKELDWEVSLKVHEKGVKDSVNIPYCLLRITYADPDQRPGTGMEFNEGLTLAVGRSEITEMIGTLTELKVALEKCDNRSDGSGSKE